MFSALRNLTPLFAKSAPIVVGVVPFDIIVAVFLTFATFQCSGTLPNHSTPESRIGALGFRPLVTAWLMTAWRFSFSSWISCCCLSIRVSILAVSWSRKFIIISRSQRGGSVISIFAISLFMIFAPLVSGRLWNWVAYLKQYRA